MNLSRGGWKAIFTYFGETLKMNRIRKPFFCPRYAFSLILLMSLIISLSPGVSKAGQHVVTALPDTIWQSEHSADAWDTVTLQGTKLTSAVSGLVLTGSVSTPPRKWFIDLASDTIIFGTGDGNSLYGLRVTGGSALRQPKDIIIQGGNIIHSPSTNSDTAIARECVVMRITGSDYLIKNVNMTAGGYNGKCLTGGSYDIEVDGGLFTSNVDYYASRCNFDGLIIGLNGTWDAAYAADSGHTYNIKIHNAKLWNIPHVGIRCDGGDDDDYGIFQIYACTVQVDARNFKYPIYSGTCYSCANPYGIAVQRAGAGSFIHSNVITSGTTYAGGRGILLETCRGIQGSPIEIYGNYIDIHEGPNAEYDENHIESHALRLRNDCQYLHVYGNTIIGTGDANPSTSSYGRSIASLRYTFEGVYGGVNSNNIIEKNIFRARSLGDNVTAYAVCFDAVSLPDTLLTFQYNRIESDNVLVKFGEVNAGAKGISLYADTLRFLSPAYNPITYAVGHLCNNWDCADNFACDEAYEEGASDTNIVFSCATSGTLEFGLARMISVNVRGRNGLGVQGALVSVSNNYGQIVLTDTTESSGLTEPPVRLIYWWESRTSNDSLNYNNFTVKAKYGSDSSIISYTMNAASADPIVTLNATDGGGTPIDTTPPKKIDDLGAATGLNDGEVRLTWTSPGDDGSLGSAEGYEIKYYTGTITESNWDGAWTWPEPPRPKNAGTSQNYTVSGLNPGQKYYFAIKAYDEIPNISPISNIAAAVAKINIILDVDDNPVALSGPPDNSIVNSSHPLLTARAESGNGRECYFEVAEDSNFIVPAAASPPIPITEDEITWKINVRLLPNKKYYWRARTDESDYGDVFSFMVEPIIHAFPNPFAPLRDHILTFTELPESCSLIIVSVSGSEVRRWTNIVGGEQTWDGTNAAGRPVGAGTYLWFIEGSEQNGKIVLIR
jgi:hypothetical protein